MARKRAEPKKEYCIIEDLELGAYEFGEFTLSGALERAKEMAFDTINDIFVMEVVKTIKGSEGEDPWDEDDEEEFE